MKRKSKGEITALADTQPNTGVISNDATGKVSGLFGESTQTSIHSELKEKSVEGESSAYINGANSEVANTAPDATGPRTEDAQESRPESGNTVKPNARTKKIKRDRAKVSKKSKRRNAEAKAKPGEVEAKAINDAHDELINECADFAAGAVPKAITLGEKLFKTKESVGHGHWEDWVEAHLKFSIATAKRYMALANPKRSAMIDLEDCSSLMEAYAAAGMIPNNTRARTVPLKLFTPAASKVLSLPIADITPADKETIRTEYERLEPIAINLYPHPSIFAVTWQKKLQEPPARWTRKDVALLREEIAKAQEVLAAIEADAQFDAEPAAPTPQVEELAMVEGDAP